MRLRWLSGLAIGGGMLGMAKNRMAITVLALLISHHALAEEQKLHDSEQGQQNLENTTKIEESLKSLGLTIRSGGAPRADGYFGLFEKQESGWKLTDISTSRPAITDFSRQEVLLFSDDLGSIQPDFRTSKYNSKRDDFECWTGALRTRKDNATTDYNPCESSLTVTSNFNVVGNVAGHIFTLGLLLPTGMSSRNVVVDKEKVLSLLQQTGALDRVREKKVTVERERFTKAYRNTFASAKMSSQFDAFVRKYSGNDPENLVPQAIMRRDELSLREAEERKRRETEEAAWREAQAKAEAARRETQAKAEEERRQYEQDQRRQRMAKVESFRRVIRVETETNCGPVLEIRGALVKVYSPVANYGNEHWIRKEQVFPPAYGCRFFNGNYEPPSL